MTEPIKQPTCAHGIAAWERCLKCEAVTEPIKLPPVPAELSYGLLTAGQCDAVYEFATLAVEQNTAELRARVAKLEAAQEGFVRDYGNGNVGELKYYVRAMRAAALKEKP